VRATLALILLAVPAAAQDLNCDDPQFQQEMNACAELGWKDADRALNALWGQAKTMAQGMDASLPQEQRGIWQAMLDGQRAWITYRDKSCEAEGGAMRGGTGEPLLIYSCMERLTRERGDNLQIFLDQGY
jgi:uncharacterized protein YecT (DUF1311 family)